MSAIDQVKANVEKNKKDGRDNGFALIMEYGWLLAGLLEQGLIVQIKTSLFHEHLVSTFSSIDIVNLSS